MLIIKLSKCGLKMAPHIQDTIVRNLDGLTVVVRLFFLLGFNDIKKEIWKKVFYPRYLEFTRMFERPECLQGEHY